MKIKPILYTFFGLVCLALLTPLIVDKDYLFPFILPRALWLRITLDLALPFYLYLILAKREYRPNLKNPLNLAVLAFLVINFISSFTGVNVIRSIWGNIERMGGAWYLLHLSMLYFYVLLIAQASSKLLLRLLKFFLWVAIASVGYGLWVYMGLPGFYADPSLPERVSSSFGNPIFFASFLILPLFLTVFFALQEESRFWKIVYWIVALLCLFGIYQSATRGAFVGLVMGIFIAAVVYMFNAPTQRLKYYGLSAIGGLVVVVGLLFILGNKLPQNSFLYRITHLKDSNSSARLIHWQTAWDGFKEKPVLGVGPENYYVTANKYYNPELNKYDPSWFDKPHNYLLEILVTTGVVGFTAYLAVLAFFAWALFKAYKAQLVSWLEVCVLLAGMLVYQIQNIFVFDTISASVAFFVYLGFGAYLWYEAGLTEKKDKAKTSGRPLDLAFVNVAFGVSLLLIFYVIYLTNITAGRVAKGINYGFAYASVDPAKSIEYFESVRKQPFVFDPGEFGMRFEDVAARLIQNPPKNMSKEQINQVADNAISVLEDANRRMDNYPIYWYKLAEVYALKSGFNNAPVPPQAIQAAQKALDLAPKRLETLFFMSQISAYSGDVNKAVSVAEKTVRLYPWDNTANWRLAAVYWMAGRQQEAVSKAQETLSRGYKISQAQEFQWLEQYYQHQNNFKAIIPLYELALKNNPQDVQLIAGLASAYAKMGDKQKAIETANLIVSFKPEAKQDVENFIKSLESLR